MYINVCIYIYIYIYILYTISYILHIIQPQSMVNPYTSWFENWDITIASNTIHQGTWSAREAMLSKRVRPAPGSNQFWLVVEPYPSETYEFVNWDDDILQYMGK